jgi:hypothetical protein
VGERIMLEELEKLVEEDNNNKFKLMRDVIPVSQHRSWKNTYLNKCVISVMNDIKIYQRRNKK